MVPLEVAHQIRVTDALTRFANDAAAANDDFFDRLDQKRSELLERPSYEKRTSRTHDTWAEEANVAACRATFDEAGADEYVANLRAIRERELAKLRGGV